jgi:hypothetical protein
LPEGKESVNALVNACQNAFELVDT